MPPPDAGATPAASGIAPSPRAVDRLAAWMFRPVDIASLVVFRIAFGLIMIWEMNRYIQYGWIDDIYVDPVFTFPYHGFSWVQPFPAPVMYALFNALALLALFIAIGLWYRVSAALFFLGFTYIFLLEKAHYLNHLYLTCLLAFLLVFVPAHRALSVDAHRHPSLRSDTVPAWALGILALQIAVIYVYGGIAKLNGDWLRGEPMRMWMAEETQFPILGRWFTEEWMVWLLTYGGLLIDLFVVPLLLWPRTRWFAVAALVLFHRLNAELFSIGIFPTLAIASIVLFLPPDLPRRIVRSIRGTSRRRPARAWTAPVTLPGVRTLSRAQRITMGLVTAYAAVQLLVPLRVHLYPGDPGWTDEGDRFAWRMMLHSKRGEITFHLTDPASGETWEVDPSDYLTDDQEYMMLGQPDLILQFSHWLADRWADDGHADVAVRAESWVSLNGREPALLVDPTVDLTQESLSPLPANWILALDVPLSASIERGDAQEPQEGDAEIEGT